MEASANAKQLDLTKLVIRHVQLNRAPKGRRRTYRAHGRVTPYMSQPFHIEVWAEENPENVQKAEPVKRVTSLKRQHMRRVRKRLTVGEQ